MALVRDLSRAQLVFKVGEGAEDQFSVVRYRGTEGLSQLYRFEIELVTDDEISFDDIVGKPGVLSINSDSGSKVFHGIVSRFEFTGEANGRMKFRAELVPAVWLLTHRYNSRIFQEKTVKEIITTVLEDGGIPSDRIKMGGVKGAATAREYCVQYRETDFNFICRLMEEEGIWWYFEQTEEGHIFTAADNKSEYADIEGESAELPFKPPSGMLATEEHVFSFRKSQSVRMGKVVLNDFNFKNPKLNLESLGDAGRDTSLEFFDYPGEFDAQAIGGNLAKMRVEEFEASRTRGAGRSNSVRLGPGKKFELTEHPSEPMNQSYLITRVTHQGRQSITDTATGAANGRAKMFSSTSYQNLVAATRTDDRTVAGIATATLDLAARLSPNDRSARRAMTEWLYHAGQICRDVSATAGALGGNPMEALAIPNLIEDVSRSEALDLDMPVYSCDFECIPAEVEYRPPRVTPWPVMRGCQTARVVGPEGEEIHCDEYGRVKVQFNWDREGKHDEKSSCWIRVAQGSAGGMYGMVFLPRIGHEVIIDFLEGDPDKPIIVGCVYNGEHKPPYSLPSEKTKSVIKTNSSLGGDGFNEIRFEDKKGSEQLFFHAEKNEDIRVKNDAKEWIGHDRHLIVKNDQFEMVENNKHSIVEADCNQKVEGNANLTVAGDYAEEIGGGANQTVKGDQAIKVAGDRSLKVSKNHNEKTDKKISTEAGTDYHQKAGKNFAIEGGAAVHIKAGMAMVIEAGTQLTLKVGGNFVDINAAGVFIKGNLVFINSGGSAGSGGGSSPVAPAPPSSPEAPKKPKEADTADPGEDKVEWPPPLSPQAVALTNAAATGAPFCELCEEAKKEEQEEQEEAQLEPPLEVESAEATAARTIDLTFNQEVDPACLEDPEKGYLRYFSVEDEGCGTLSRNPHDVALAGKKATLTWSEGDMINGLSVTVRARGALYSLEGEDLDPRCSIATCGGNGVDPIEFEGIKITTARSLQMLFSKDIATEDIVFEDGRKISVQAPTSPSRYQVEIQLPVPWKGRPEQVSVSGNKIILHFAGRPFANGQRLVVYSRGKVWDTDGLNVSIDNDSDSGKVNPYRETNVSVGPGRGGTTGSSSGSD